MDEFVLDLNKGDEFNLDLTKQVNFDIALRWDCSNVGEDMDLDVSAFMLKQVGDKRKLTSPKDVVYFKEDFMTSTDGSVSLSGDSLDGSSDGDDEVISINTSKIASDIAQINIYVNIYSPKVSFKAVSRAQAFVRTSDGKVLAHVDMSTDFQNENSILVGFVSKVNGNWTFTAGGEGYIIQDLNTIVKSLHTEGV